MRTDSKSPPPFQAQQAFRPTPEVRVPPKAPMGRPWLAVLPGASTPLPSLSGIYAHRGMVPRELVREVSPTVPMPVRDGLDKADPDPQAVAFSQMMSRRRGSTGTASACGTTSSSTSTGGTTTRGTTTRGTTTSGTTTGSSSASSTTTGISATSTSTSSKPAASATSKPADTKKAPRGEVRDGLRRGMKLPDVTRWVTDHGCTFDHITGSHCIYKRPDGNIVVVPRHDSLDTGTMKSIEKQVLENATDPQLEEDDEEAHETSSPHAPGKDETGGYKGKWLTALHCPLQAGDKVRLQRMNDRARDGPELQAVVVGGDTSAADPDKRFVDVQLKPGDSLRDGDGKSLNASQRTWRIQPGDEAVRIKTERRGLCPSFKQAQGGLSDQVIVRGVPVRHVIAEEVGGVQMLKVTVGTRKDTDALAPWRVGNSIGNKNLNIFYLKFIDAQLRSEGSTPVEPARFHSQRKPAPMDDVKHGPQARHEKEDIELKSKPSVVAPGGLDVASNIQAQPVAIKPIAPRAFVLIQMGKHFVSAQLLSEPGGDRLGLKALMPPLPEPLFGKAKHSPEGEHVYWPPGLASPQTSTGTIMTPFSTTALDSICGSPTVWVKDVPATWVAFDRRDSSFSVLAAHGAFDGHKPLSVSQKDGKDLCRFAADTVEVRAEFHTLAVPVLEPIKRGSMVFPGIASLDTMAQLASEPGQLPTILVAKKEIPFWNVPGVTRHVLTGDVHAYFIPVECPSRIRPSTFYPDQPAFSKYLPDLLDGTRITIQGLEMSWSAIDPSDTLYHDFHLKVTIPVLFKDQAGHLEPGSLGLDKLLCVKMTYYQALLMPEGVAVPFDEPQDAPYRFFVRRDKSDLNIPSWSIEAGLRPGAALDPSGQSKWQTVESPAMIPPRASVLITLGPIQFLGQLLSEPGVGQLSLKTAKPLTENWFGPAVKGQEGGYIHRPPDLGSPAQAAQTHLRPVPPTQLASIPRSSTVQVKGVPAVWVTFDARNRTFSVLAARGAFDGLKPLTVTSRGEKEELRFAADAAPVMEVVYHVTIDTLALMTTRSLVMTKAGLARLDSTPGRAPTVLLTKHEVPSWNRRGISRHEHNGVHAYSLPMASPSHARSSGSMASPSSSILRELPDGIWVNVDSVRQCWSDTDPGASQYHDFHRDVTIPTLFKDQAGHLKPDSLGWDKLICLQMSSGMFDMQDSRVAVRLDEPENGIHRVFIRRDRVSFTVPVWTIETAALSTGLGLTGAPNKDGVQWRPAKAADLPHMASVVHAATMGHFDSIRLDVSLGDYVELNNQKAIMFRAGHEQGDEVSVLRGISGDPLPNDITMAAQRSRAKGRSRHATQPVKAKNFSITLIPHPEKHRLYLMTALSVKASLGRQKLEVGIEKGQSDHQELLEGELTIETCKLSELFVSGHRQFLMVGAEAGQPTLPAAPGPGEAPDGKGAPVTGTASSATTTTSRSSTAATTTTTTATKV